MSEEDRDKLRDDARLLRFRERAFDRANASGGSGEEPVKDSTSYDSEKKQNTSRRINVDSSASDGDEHKESKNQAPPRPDDPPDWRKKVLN